MKNFIEFYCILIIFQFVNGDIYMHNPRGANNRLNEPTATRTNDNRLFNSQNNERGGYNVGDQFSTAFQNESGQYQMRYFQSGVVGKSYLTIEWTDQHGCGGNEDTNPTKQNCNMVLQYLCDEATTPLDSLDRLRDGLNTQSQGYTNMATDTKQANLNRKQGDVSLNLGLQETWDSYDDCNYRQRNNGLFTADQGLKNNNKGYSSAVFTRQNPGGGRSGYECPEERDYYPYWHPTVWKDIAILTSNTTLCNQIYNGSFNVQPYYKCVEFYPDNTRKHWSRWNNQNDCVNNNGTWQLFYNYLEKATGFTNQQTCEAKTTSTIVYKWALPYDSTTMVNECLVLLNAPVCQQAAWTRSNHLGNTPDGVPANFTWSLPYFPSKQAKKCVLRIRYNISTDDYDPFGTNSNSNNQNSPVLNNPTVQIGNKNLLQLAINTAQYGRTFQDRSHAFYLLPRTTEISDNAFIYNLNVRGKRGNIVQVYPAVEYDFIPNQLNLGTADILHIQWTGSNTHNNGGNGGDGQAGDDGQGQGGTDRSNFVEVNILNENFPLPYETCNIWSNTTLIGYLDPTNTNTPGSYLIKNSFSSKDLALYLSSSSYYQCVDPALCGANSFKSQTKLDADLNSAPASLPGALVQFKNSKRVFYYMCSRNNNFSNRSQKGKITVS